MSGRAFVRSEILTGKGKFILVCLCVLPLFLGIIPLKSLLNRTYVVFPTDSISNQISAHTDGIWDGNSKIREFAYDNNSIVLKYLLEEGVKSPLVFITINLASAEKPLDLSCCDSVSIKLRDATNKRMMLFIKTYVPGVSLPEPKNAHTLRHNQFILQLAPDRYQYKIKLKDFITPPWWLDNMKVNKALLPKETYHNVMTFDMQFNQEGSDYNINQLETVIIENISFHRALSPLNYILAGLLLVYYLVIAVFLLRRNSGKEVKRLPTHRTVEVTSYREKEFLRIMEFVESNYCSTNISTKMVADKLGISSSRVFELLKEEYNLTFKQLINKLRIDEAKRLLRETDLRITDIALNLGFNNVSYFNNLFKLSEGKTPSKYREEEGE